MRHLSLRSFGFLALALLALSSCKVLNGTTVSPGSGGGGGQSSSNSPGQSSEARLSGMSLSAGTLSPSFNANTSGYTVSIPGSENPITISPNAQNGNATIQISVNGGNPTSVSSGGTSSALTLTAGSNTITVTVTSQDGSTTKTYTITATVSSDSAVPTLGSAISLTPYTSSVSITWGAATDDTTSQANLVYKVVRASTTSEIDTVAEADAAANVVLDWTANTTSVNATGLSSSTTYAFAVLVKDQAGNKSLYTPKSTTTSAASSTDATLGNLSISSGSLSPSFTPSTETYSVSVSSLVTSVTITPTVNQATATVQVRVNSGSYSSVSSGAASGALSLSLGANTIDVKVTAGDGVTTKTYTITVTQTVDTTAPTVGTAINLDATATTVDVTWGAATDNVSAAANLQYKVVRASATADIDTVGEADSAVNVVMNWTANTTSVTASSLSSNTTYAFAVLVKDETGNKSLYTPASITTSPLTSSDATLSGLSLSSGTLSPVFEPSTTSYTAAVSGSTSSITVTPTANESHATIQVRVNGGSYSTVTSGSASSAISLTAGDNDIEVKVVSQDLSTTKIYAIKVNRNSDSSAPTVGTAISLTAYPTTIGISWGAASDNVTSAANLKYKVVQASSTTAIDTVAEADAAAIVVMDWTANVTSTNAVGLSTSTTYAFAVLVQDEAGNISLYTPASKATTAADTTAPSLSSSSISASVSANSITLTWTAATDTGTPQDLIQYQVYQGLDTTVNTLSGINTSLSAGDGVVTELNSWTNGLTTYTISGLVPNTTYYFNVVAQDQAASPNQVAYAGVSATTSGDTTAPTAGSGITGTPGVTFVSLSWGAASDAVTLAANLQYKVVRASSTADIDTLTEINNGNGTLVMSYSAGATSTIVTGLTANTSYAFAVVVKDEAGNEALYSPITKTTLASDTANPTVTGLSISTIAHPTSIDLSWGAATDDGTPPAYLLYRVYMTSGASNTIGTPADAQTNGTAVTDWTVGMTSATADGLSMGTNYAFAVLVKDGSGKTSLIGPATETTLTDSTDPVAGASFSATGTSASTVALSWSAATDNITTGSKLQYKVVQASSSNAIDTKAEADAITSIVIDWTANITSAQAAELTKNTTYYFSVLVKDEAGNMALYGPRSATTTNPSDSTPPTVGGSGVLTTTTGTDSSGNPYITVSWTAATDSVTSGANLQYQLVSSSVESNLDSISKALSGTVIKSWFTSSASTISATASNLASGTLYAFNVIVKDQAGNMTIYTPTSETTDISGVPGAITLTTFPSGESSKTLSIRSLNGQKAGFVYTISGDSTPYYYQYFSGKSSGSTNNNYLVKFSTSGALQTGFGSSGWKNLKNVTNVPNYKGADATYHWQVCNGKVYALGYTASNTYKLFQVTLTSTSLTFSTAKTTITSSPSNMKDLACVGTNLYVSWVDNSSGYPQVFQFDGTTGTTSGTYSSGTAYMAPFVDSASKLWFYDANNSSPAFHNPNLANSTVTTTNSISASNFPTVAYPSPAPSAYGFFGGFQPTVSSDTVMHAASGSSVRIWNDTADNLLSNLKAGLVTPTVSYSSSTVKPLSYGTITDGKMCRAAGKYLGHSFYKYYSTTFNHTGSYYGFSIFLANADGSRGSAFNKGSEFTFRNKIYSSSDGSGKKSISLTCDDASSTAVAAFRLTRGNTVLVFMGLDANLP